MPDSKYALILSGGAARGAYEVGILKYIFHDLNIKYNFKPNFKIICGTSVGAIHACHLASNLHNMQNGIIRLVQIWENLNPNQVAIFNPKSLSIKNLLFGGTGSRANGLVDVSPLRTLLQNEGNWSSIRNNINNELLETLCISSTCIRTGRTNIFTQSNQKIPEHIGFRSIFKEAEINVNHAMASASLPILFPPVEIDSEWYTDGGIRHNTPIAPAVAFNASHVFVIGMWHESKIKAINIPSQSPGLGLILGKIFNSFFIDNAQYDLYNLNVINSIIENANKYAPGFESKPYRYITSCALTPSEDIGTIAAEYLSSRKYRKHRLYRLMLKMADTTRLEADLASYLLFDGEFSKLLIELGYNDAKRNEDKILKFFDIG